MTEKITALQAMLVVAERVGESVEIHATHMEPSKVTGTATIVGHYLSPDVLLDKIRALAPDAVQVLNGAASGWSGLSIDSDGAVLRITRRVREQPGDEFSKAVLGLYNMFRNAAVHDAAGATRQDEVLSVILRAGVLLGIVVEPEFSEESGHYDLIFGLASVLDGMVLNGEAMFDSTGKLFLHADGTYE